MPALATGSLLPSASADGWMIVPAKAHRRRGFASKLFKPSAEADGKREFARSRPDG